MVEGLLHNCEVPRLTRAAARINIPLPPRKMEKILTLPRRKLVKVRLAGVMLRTRGSLLQVSLWPPADRWMMRTLPLSCDANNGFSIPFLFRVVTRDIILIAQDSSRWDQ